MESFTFKKKINEWLVPPVAGLSLLLNKIWRKYRLGFVVLIYIALTFLVTACGGSGGTQGAIDSGDRDVSTSEQAAQEQPDSVQRPTSGVAGAAGAAQKFLKARTTDDIETAVRLSCPAHQAEVRSTSEWIAEVNAQVGGRAEELSDISGVTFETVAISGDTADVHAQGVMTVAFKGEPLTAPMEETYIMKQIDGAWLYCGAHEK